MQIKCDILKKMADIHNAQRLMCLGSMTTVFTRGGQLVEMKNSDTGPSNRNTRRALLSQYAVIPKYAFNIP